MHEAWCYEKIGNKSVICNLCIIGCNIGEGKKGVCQTRENQDGTLFSLTYGKLSSFSTDFVEKVPLYHFFPNQRFLTVGGLGCNLSCKFCLTWSITQAPLDEIPAEKISPDRLIKAAMELKCRGIAYTHSEPTLNIEFYSELMEKSKEVGLKNVLATNGFISLDAFGIIAKSVDAVSLTFKGGSDFYKKVCGVRYDGDHFTRIIKLINDSGIHLEIVYVLIPRGNDDESLDEVITIAKEAMVPLIFLRFFPSYEMEETESPSEESLERALNLAYEKGVEYAYIENIYEHPGKNTYCPKCKCTLIEREGYGIVSWGIKGQKCRNCGYVLPIVGEAFLAGL
jgi:pyruvate formate lyase activating enzyme